MVDENGDDGSAMAGGRHWLDRAEIPRPVFNAYLVGEEIYVPVVDVIEEISYEAID